MKEVRAQAQHVIDSLDGEVTKHEVDTFISGVAATTIPTSQWAGGTHNRELKPTIRELNRPNTERSISSDLGSRSGRSGFG
jgi:hypothetical protein